MSKPMQGLMSKKFGYKVLKEIKYSEVKVDGEYPMAKFIEDHPEYKDETIMFALKAL